MTNRDKLKNMSNKELAKTLQGRWCNTCAFSDIDCSGKKCVNGVKKWLITPCTDEPVPPIEEKYIGTNRSVINAMNNDDFIEFLQNRCDCMICLDNTCHTIDCIDNIRNWLEKRIDDRVKWKPDMGDEYYYTNIEFSSKFSSAIWQASVIDRIRYDFGLVCRTETEVIEMIQKIQAVAKECKDDE